MPNAGDRDDPLTVPETVNECIANGTGRFNMARNVDGDAWLSNQTHPTPATR